MITLAVNYNCNASAMLYTVPASPRFERWDDRPVNMNVTEGGTARISCKTAAEPTASVVWLRNAEPLDCTSFIFVCIF